MTTDNTKLTAVVRELIRDKGNVVYEWPDDEAAAYRDNGGFEEGRAAVDAVRVTKGVAAVQAIIQTAHADAQRQHAEEMTIMTASSLTPDPYVDPEQQAAAFLHLSAVHRLATSRKTFPELSRAEAEARVNLAAAVMKMDEVDDLIETGEKIHSLNEQADVEMASRAYVQALSALVRGER